MKFIKKFKIFENIEVKNQLKIEDYPQSVRLVYNRFNVDQKRSIDDNLEGFAKKAKKLFYFEGKNWKNYFNKDVKKLTTLTDIIKSMDKWME